MISPKRQQERGELTTDLLALKQKGQTLLRVCGGGRGGGGGGVGAVLVLATAPCPIPMTS